MNNVFCTKCAQPFEIDSKDYESYFQGVNSICPHCSRQQSVWKLVVSALNNECIYDSAFTFIDAERTLVTLKLIDNNPVYVRFGDYGIPETSKILYVNYIPAGGKLFPLEMQGSIPLRSVPNIGVTLYPVDLLPNGVGNSEVYLSVSWVDSDNHSKQSYSALCEALQKYFQQDFEGSVMAANTAIELEVTQFAKNVISGITSESNAKEFLSISTYVPTLKTLLPLITSLKGKTLMTKRVQEELIGLATLRNQIAHTGSTEGSLNKKQAANLLAGVILGLKYLHWIK